MRSSKTRESLKEILPLINDNCFMEAALKWRDQQVVRKLCSDVCPYGKGPEVLRCALCLEGRLRAVSLISAERNCQGDCPYAKAGNAIDAWLGGLEEALNDTANFPMRAA